MRKSKLGRGDLPVFLQEFLFVGKAELISTSRGTYIEHRRSTFPRDSYFKKRQRKGA